MNTRKIDKKLVQVISLAIGLQLFLVIQGCSPKISGKAPIAIPSLKPLESKISDGTSTPGYVISAGGQISSGKGLKVIATVGEPFGGTVQTDPTNNAAKVLPNLAGALNK